jgi:hypothetical protein
LTFLVTAGISGFPAVIAGFDLHDELVFAPVGQPLRNLDVRPAEHPLMLAQQHTVEPDPAVIRHAVEAQNRGAAVLLRGHRKAAAVIPDLFIHPVVGLAVGSHVRMGQHAGIEEVPVDGIGQRSPQRVIQRLRRLRGRVDAAIAPFPV